MFSLEKDLFYFFFIEMTLFSLLQNSDADLFVVMSV